MKLFRSWYQVSVTGWLVTVVHATLSFLVIKGIWEFDKDSIEIEFIYGATYMYLLLLLILFYAKLKGHKIFSAEK